MVELDGAGDGCFVGVVCHGAVHFSESEVELVEVGSKTKSTRPRSTLQGLKVNSW